MTRCRILVLLALLGGLVVAPEAAAQPAWLPRYDLDIRLDVYGHHVSVRQRVTWINRHARPTSEMVFNVYPRYKVSKDKIGLTAKTVEILRLSPSEAVDFEGQNGEIVAVRWLGSGPAGLPPEALATAGTGVRQASAVVTPPTPAAVAAPPTETLLPFHYRPDIPTALVVPLPRPVAQGQAVTVELEYTLRLSSQMGRWCQWPLQKHTKAVLPGTITTLTTWTPLLAYYDDSGWQPMPFIPWHQPFFNEAGWYRATITVPADQQIACSAPVGRCEELPDGWKRVETLPLPLRDFALLCSAAYQEFSRPVALPGGRTVTVKCMALPQHAFYANEILRIVADAMPIYSAWFGNYPYDQFTVAESYFGWNGNEAAGLVMIDQRVFAMPHVAVGFVEYLMSHELLHQWFYNVIGTNGYCETFMDEGVVVHFTHRMLDQIYGKNNKIIKWPDGLKWMPTIHRDDYRFASFYGSVRKGEMGPTVQPLDKYPHLVALFSAAYDRGGQVIGMIEDRLGSEAMLDFFRLLYRKYYFRILRVDDFQRELEAYTGQSWQEFFENWIYGKGLSDWAVDKVRRGPNHQVSVYLSQRGDITEPTTLGVRLRGGGDDYQIRVPVLPSSEPVRIDDPPALIEPVGDQRYRVTLALPSQPEQITVDPDRILVDSDPANNSWKTPFRFRFSPVFTLLDETDYTNAYDRWNVTAGPWLYSASYADPWYTRSTLAGFRLGAYRTQKFQGGVFTAYRTDYRDFIVGADALLDHFPGPYWQVGFNVEQRIGDPLGASGPSDVTRAVGYARRVLIYNSSLYLPPIKYVEGFVDYQDNELPFARTFTPGAVRPERTTTMGLHYRLNYLVPYWNPEFGIQFDITGGGGLADLEARQGYAQFQSQLAGVYRLGESFGVLEDTRLAGRLNVTGALPNRGQFFALGGGSLFRGFDLAERQGSLFWLASAEMRVPVLKTPECDVCDHIAGLRSVYLAGFYDVGEIYANGDSVGGVAHALGLGVRLDVVFLSLLERTSLRFDVAKALNEQSTTQMWFGVLQPF